MIKRLITLSALFALVLLPVGLFGQTVVASLLPYETTTYTIYKSDAAHLSSTDKGAFGVSYSSWLPGSLDATVLNAKGFFNISPKIGVSIGYTQPLLKPFPIVNDQGVDLGQFTPIEFAAEGGVSALIFKRVSASVNFKYIYSDIGGPLVGQAVAGDVSLLYHPGAFNLGVKVANLGSAMDWGNGAHPLPAFAELGSLYNLTMGKNHTLLFSGRAALLFSDGSPLFAAGLEYALKESYFLRVGGNYAYGADNLPSFLSVGAGVKLAGINLNFVYLLGQSDTPINGSFSIGLGYSF